MFIPIRCQIPDAVESAKIMEYLTLTANGCINMQIAITDFATALGRFFF